MLRSVLVLILVAGCATWTKPGGTPEALKADQAACAEAASRDFPPRLAPPPHPDMGVVQPGYTCLPSQGCVPTGSSYLTPPSAVDMNAPPRDAAFRNCMEKRGWSR